VGTDGFSTYDYSLVDTISIRGEKAFQIRYQPKRKDVLAFREIFILIRILMPF
jgi:hypothetical protein